MNDVFFMNAALRLAKKAAGLLEVPVGAVVVFEGQIIAEGYNQRESLKNPLAHAEILAIEQASKKLGRWRLSGCTLYVTLEPCCMCAGALINARLDRLVYGALDLKGGAIKSLYQIGSDSRLNHRLIIESGLLAEASSELLSSFFRRLRS